MQNKISNAKKIFIEQNQNNNRMKVQLVFLYPLTLNEP